MLLPLNSHRSSVLWIQESFVVTLSCLAVGSLWLVSFLADSTKTVTFHFVYTGWATPLLYGDLAPAKILLINNACSFKKSTEHARNDNEY